jgi:hypothetical protein
MPGVDEAGAVLVTPYLLDGVGSGGLVIAEGQTSEEAEHNPVVNWQVATPGYFRAMGIQLLAGRDFAPTDDERAPPVAIVSQQLARRLWPGERALGRRLRTYGLPETDPSEPAWATVIGIVGNVRYLDVRGTRWNLYLSYRQATPSPGHLNYVMRTKQEPNRVRVAVVAAIHDLDPREPPIGLAPLEEVVSDVQAPWRLAALLLSVLAALATALTALGVFAVVSRSVSLRRKEFGVRMALGAPLADILRNAAGRLLGWILFGTAAGLAFARLAAQGLTSLLFEVEPTDPTVFVSIAVLVLAIAVGACLPGAVRAAFTDPSSVLRTE